METESGFIRNGFAILSLAVSIAAVVLAMLIPGPPGPEGPVAPGLAEPFVWGYAVILSCSGTGAQPERTDFKILYANIGNETAVNASAHYFLHYGGPPSFGVVEGIVPLGSVPRLTTGNATETVPFPCSHYGQDVEVEFAWD